MVLQTGWKIEPCYRLSDTQSDSGSQSRNSPIEIDQSLPPQNDTLVPSNDEAAEATAGTVQPESLATLTSNHPN